MTRQEFIDWSAQHGKVRLFGKEYVLVKNPRDTDGAVATQEQYDNFLMSYAHAHTDGRGVMRFGVKIAEIDDLEAVRE